MRPRQAIDDAARRLAAAGVPSARHDAEALVAHVLGVDRRDLWRHDEIKPGVKRSYDDLVARRERREPLQHLTGVAYFRHLTMLVGPGVFVPRPETEIVAGAAIDEARQISIRDRPAPLVVDLGTGSGAIACSVADEVPAAVVHAVELADDAVAWARRNIDGSGVTLHHGDLASALPGLDGTVDVVVSNPPYIPLDGVPRDPEVRDHDPATSLYAGVDGLDVIRVVAGVAARLLRPGGLVVVEHADEQGRSAPAIFDTACWTEIADHDDLASRPRFVTARRAKGRDTTRSPA
jgi:release factor glutamine methyltransferase